jgi:hypothetical protein
VWWYFKGSSPFLTTNPLSQYEQVRTLFGSSKPTTPRSIQFVRGCGGEMAGRKKKENMAVLYKRVPLRLKAELQKLVNEYVKKHE